MKRIALGVAVLLGLASGCADWHERLVPQASFDLSCPPAQLQIALMGDHVAGVVGCGQKATYIDVCRGMYGTNCQWMMNNKAGGVPGM